MNKIYKVIWSKTRNCYVAVAEFVKRNGKGGSVLNRRHIAAALAAVAICAAPVSALANTGGHWDGDNYIGDAPDYNVTINEEVKGIAYGRYETGNVGASGATLSIVTNGKVDVAFAGRAASGNVTGNKVVMTGGEIVDLNPFVIESLNVSGMLFGGFADAGKAEKNTVEISGGTVNSWVIGGYVEKGEANSNTVTISGGTVRTNVHGGFTFCGNAENNAVTIEDGTVQEEVFGGYSNEGKVENNTVTITGGTVGAYVFGGDSDSGNAVNNTVTISGGTVGGVYGGFSVNGTAGGDKPEDGNHVTLSGGSVEGWIYGGSSKGKAKYNTVTITGGTVGRVYGGNSSGDAANNEVTITGGTVSGYVFGGESSSGNAVNNTVTISGGTVGGVYGGFSVNGTAGGDKPEDGNHVTLSGGSVEGGIYGGHSVKGKAKYNSVTIADGIAEGVVYGGYSESHIATYNTVTITGGTVNGDVYGGWSKALFQYVAKNTVIIRGGEVNNSVHGGYSLEGDAKDNTVILSKVAGKEAPVIKGTLFGGFSERGGTVSGNTLQVEAVGLSAPEIQNFDNYRFVLPDGSKKGDVLLSLNKQDADLTIDGRKVSVSMTGSTVADIGLKLDESVTLLEKTGGSGAFTVENADKLPTWKAWLDNKEGGFETQVIKAVKPDGEDKLNLTVTEKFLYGDGGTNTPGQRERGNTLEIKGGKATAAFGGRATTGDVTGNKVEMSGGELVYDTLYADIQGSLYGGLADSLTDKGNANHNTVTVSGGKLKERVYGGASYDGNTENNTVTIKGGTVGTHVYGGRTYGGGNAVNNTVTIEGGTVGKRVYGGRSDGGNAVNNTVTIKGGTVGERVYGGFSNGDDAERNTVNLTGTTHGLDGAKLYGYNDGAASHSGNELHIGGAKTYDKNGEAVITKGSWQGMDGSGKHTNRVDTVSNFDSIALHNVVWGDVPALAAKEIKNIGGLDVTGLEFFTHPDNSTVHKHALKDYMVLVHADTNDLTGLKISYLDEGNVKTETLTNQGIHYHNTVHHSTENGVTVDGTEKKRIYLADHNKSVDFCFHVTGDKLTVGEVDFVKNGTARILDGRFDVRNAAIDTEGMTFSEASWNIMHTGDTMTLVDAEDAIANKNGATLQPFTTRQITKTFAESDAAKSITIEGLRTGTLAQDAAQTKLTYTVGTVDIDTVRLGAVSWNPNGTLLNAGGDVFHYGTVQAVDVAGFTVDYKNPQTVEANKTMTLLQANNTLQANALLQKMAADEKTKTHSYQFAPADGVTVAARITGNLGTTAKGDGFTYTVNSNQADRLTFGSVDWKDSGALLKRPAAVTFTGADVDTSKIHFKNVHGLDAGKQMTLVSDFGNKAGNISGSKYYIGTTLEGEGKASLSGNDLVFTTLSSTNPDPENPTPTKPVLHAQDQTHNTVMGMTAGLAALAGGTEQISQAMDSFGGTTGSGSSGSTGNAGDNTTNGSGSSDSGQSSGGQEETESGGMIIASVGGNKMHQETGSHVTSNTWNGVLGIGGKRAVKSGTWQYAAFAEHGRANFTLHSDAGRGDGTSKYTGGGLLAKWQNRHDVYVEGSIRAGRMHDTASDLLYDAATGQSYGYDVHANYIGGHVGFGKVFRYNNGRSLDVYGKYFHMKRDGVSFEAEGHYDLDSVTSSVLRVGARYSATDKKWNWYGGLAYEYEFDGKATGRADGAEIRAASIKGGSVRGELGLRMEATKTSPWKADIRLTGYAGKRRGIGGNVSVAYTF